MTACAQEEAGIAETQLSMEFQASRKWLQRYGRFLPYSNIPRGWRTGKASIGSISIWGPFKAQVPWRLDALPWMHMAGTTRT